MSKQIQLRRGTTTEHATFTGAQGEATVDVTKKTIVVHDGFTAGGTPLAKESDISVLQTNKADKISTYTKEEVTNAIATAIANLINGSPAALDTINELATALGNDAHFSTTIINALALKAPLDGAVLTNATLNGLSKVVIGYLANLTSDAQTQLNAKVSKVASTNNALPRFDGTTGAIKNSNIIVDDNGNIGIGVTPSASTLPTIESQYNMLAGQEESNLNTNAYYYGGVFKYIANGYAISYIQQKAGGYHFWKVSQSGIAGNPITWTNAMTLDPNGSLNVSGNITSGYNGSVFTENSYIINYGGVSNSYILIQGKNTSAGSSFVLEASVAGVRKSAILDNGTFQSATNSYGSTSDAKLKENVVDATPKLEKLMQVKVRNFNYIGDEHKQIGVVAQEIEQIFPSIVYETKDTKQVEVRKTRQVIDKEAVLSEDGVVLEEATYKDEEYTEFETVETGETTKNVKYSVIYMMMLKAMQEQQEIINALKARVEVLETKNA